MTRRFAIAAVVFLAAVVCLYLLFVQTSWGQTFDSEAYLGRSSLGRAFTLFDTTILEFVSKGSIALVSLIYIGVAVARRCVFAGIVVVLTFWTAVVSAELLKHFLPRPDLTPLTAEMPKQFVFDTYPSGHTTIGTSVALAAVILVPARWRPWTAVAAGFVSGSYATAVLYGGWHRPSDAIGGILMTSGYMCIAVLIISWRGRYDVVPQPQHTRRPLAAAAALAVFLFALTWAVVAFGPDDAPDADMPFLVMDAIITALAFGCAAWFGQMLKFVDWPRPQPAGSPAAGAEAVTATP